MADVAPRENTPLDESLVYAFASVPLLVVMFFADAAPMASYLRWSGALALSLLAAHIGVMAHRGAVPPLTELPARLTCGGWLTANGVAMVVFPFARTSGPKELLLLVAGVGMLVVLLGVVIVAVGVSPPDPETVEAEAAGLLPFAKRFQPHEPLSVEGSPVAWVSDAVWQQRGQLSRAPGLYSEASLEQPLWDVTPKPVAPARKRRARVAPGELAVSPSSALPEALDGTPTVGFWWNPGDWPVCCDQLGTLVLANPTWDELEPYEGAGTLDAGLPWEEDEDHFLTACRRGEVSEVGVNVFQCGTCQRLYVEVTMT